METILIWSRSILSTTPSRWLSLAEAVAGELLSRPPAEKEWSALECLEHLIETERSVFPIRIQAILEKRDFPTFLPNEQGTKKGTTPTPGERAQEFAQLRKQSLAILEKVTHKDLQSQALHQELGMVSMSELLHEWSGHDLMHTVQAERALMQPFIDGCGPWRSYFVDHVVKPK